MKAKRSSRRPKAKITSAMFLKRFGMKPTQDDLQRVNCSKAGTEGHRQCGVCSSHGRPRFECGCLGKSQ
jgi:hypothetical protein